MARPNRRRKATSERNFGMSILIDELLELRTQNQEINGKWYIAKPIDCNFGIATKIHRLKDAYRVLTGKSRAYHFKEDEINE